MVVALKDTETAVRTRNAGMAPPLPVPPPRSFRKASAFCTVRE